MSKINMSITVEDPYGRSYTSGISPCEQQEYDQIVEILEDIDDLRVFQFRNHEKNERYFFPNDILQNCVVTIKTESIKE